MSILTLGVHVFGHTLRILALVLLFSVSLTLVYDIFLYLRLPPGPRPYPFLGNKLQIPTRSPWIQFQDWSRKYGPIFTLWIGRRPTLVVSDPQVATELLEKRSHNYSSRPRTVVMGEIYWDMAPMLVQPYGKKWSVRRKLFHSAMTPKALELYKPVQQAEASRLCWQLLHEPRSWEKLFDRFTSSVVFSVSYGHRIDSLDAKVIRDRLGYMQYSASLNVPGRFLAETFPILAHVPSFLAPWKREVQRRGQLEANANLALLSKVEGELSAAKDPSAVPDSLTKLLLQSRELDPQSFASLSRRDFSFLPASLFGAGSDTTSSTMCSLILALVTHPFALDAAHAELDAIIGADRTPRFTDAPSLPYLNALILEALRWRPVAVLGGTPHASVKTDTYNGYFIPGGTTILGNSWAINLNDEYYPDPHRFNPLRFLTVPRDSLPYLPESHPLPQPSRKSHPSKDGHSSFGWGRRVCPGAGLAQNSLFAAVSKMLWAFEISPVEGCIYDTFDYTQGFNIRPRPFEVIWQVRSEQRQRILEREREQADKVMSKFGLFEE